MKQNKRNENKILLTSILAIVVLAIVTTIAFLAIGVNVENETIVGQKGTLYASNEEEQNEEKGKVIVKYVDESGDEISTSEEIEGEIGTEYTTQRKNIDHYKSNGAEPINKSGNFKGEDITVTYVYKPVAEAIDLKSENNVITLKVENELNNREYKLRLEQESLEGDKLTGGKFTLFKDTNTKLVQGTTTNGKLTLGVININAEGTDNYAISEDEAPKGYEKALKEKKFNMKFVKTFNDNTKEYELNVTSDDTEFELEVDSENNEIIVKVKNKIVKKYDLAIKMFASSINNKPTQRNIEARVDDEGKVVYDETEEDIVVRDSEKIVYTIRVFNEENEDMEGKTITQVLPKGLKFLNDSEINTEYEWSEEDNKVTTDYISGETIEGINTSTQEEVDYKELKLELEVSEDDADEENNDLTNVTSIPVDDKEEREENNQFSETINLVRTPAIYDLAVKKFASKIDGEDTGRTVTAKLNDLEEIEYEENDEEKTVTHGQKIIYTIRVYNEGNKNLNGTKITDTLPSGLTMLDYTEGDGSINDTYGWKKNGSKVETSYLENKTIEGVRTYLGELPKYEDLQIEVVLDEDDVPEAETELVNQALAEKAENETDDLDNSDTDELTLSRRPKTYDFVLKMFASKIDGGDTSRNAIASLDEQNQIKYTKNTPDKSVKDAQKVIYTIRVFNQGTGNLLGTKVTDYIPEGLKFVEDSEINEEYGWELNEEVAQTSYLENKTINGSNLRRGELPNYIDLKVEFEVVEDDLEETDKIVNVAKIQKAENETNEANNEDSDSLDLTRRPKTYDLAIKKFASKIDGEDTGRSVTVSLTSENEIEYIEVTPEKIVKEGQKVIYTVRIYNEGNQQAAATKIIENIPNGLKFVEGSTTNQDNGWVKNGEKIETTILADQPISGVRTDKGEIPNYKEVFVELEVTRDGLNSDSHIITNTVQVEKAQNETDLEDNTAQDSVTLEKRPIYELAIKKFASKIDGQDTGRNVTVGLNANDEIEYTKTTVEKMVKDGQKVIYTLRIFNEGNVLITGTKISETIPQGLNYLQESEINETYGWSKQGNTVTTNYIVGKSINAYNKAQPSASNFIDVKIEFEVVEDNANENNLITNKASIAKHESEVDVTNNEDTDTINLQRKIKTYDLAMKKFVYSLDGQKLDKEVTASVNENSQIVYANDDTKTNVSKGQKVVFTLRTFNIGNQTLTGKEVIDTIPQGLKFIENSTINEQFNWTLENGIAKTDYLVGKTINGFEIEENASPKYIDVKIELEVTGEGILANQEMVNKAKIDADDKETNSENNEDEEIVILVPEKQRVYDLSMKKFLFSVDGQKLSNREIIAKNENGKIVFSKNDDIYKVSNNQKLIYTLRVYNLGDGEGNGRTVIENIPKGLEFIADSKVNKTNAWKMYKKDIAGNLVEVKNVEDATIVKTDALKGKTIAGFEVANNEVPRYKDVQIELVVKEDKLEGKNRIATNVASVEKSRLEPDPDDKEDNDQDEEKVYVKEFDLNVIKYIESITIKDDKGEKTTQLGLDKKGQLFKREIDKKKVNKTQVYVTYGLKVTNIGEIAGYATEITDYIPKDFELTDSKKQWKVSGNTVKTNMLANQIIEPGNSRVIHVSFKWKLNSNNLGERNNIAIISGYKNDYNAKDKTPDKDNEDKFIISLKTGLFEISIAIVIVILMTTATVIFIKIRKNTKK